MMFKNHRDNHNRRIFLTAISAAVLVGAFVIGSQLIQPSMAQDLGGQMGEQAGQMGEQVKEKVGGALQNMTGGANQTGNRTGEGLEQLGEKIQGALPGQ